MTASEIKRMEAIGRMVRSGAIHTYAKPRSKAPQAVLALVLVGLLVAAVFGNARQYRANVAQATTIGGEKE